MDKKDGYEVKRRRYGWGFIPVTWHGWVFIVAQVGIIFTAAFFLPMKPEQPTVTDLIKYFIILGLVVLSLVIFGLMTGPKPRWRWGKKPTDNPDEDF